MFFNIIHKDENKVKFFQDGAGHLVFKQLWEFGWIPVRLGTAPTGPGYPNPPKNGELNAPKDGGAVSFSKLKMPNDLASAIFYGILNDVENRFDIYCFLYCWHP